MDNLGRTADSIGTRDFGGQTAMRPREEHAAVEVAAGGSLMEAVAGLAAVVLAIIGLAGVYPFYLTAIAVLVLGVGFILRTGSMFARFSAALPGTADVGGGASAELMGGAAGIVLGVLSLLHIVPGVLLPVAVIVFGATVLLACASLARWNTFSLQRDFAGNELSRRVTGETVAAAGGGQVLIGVAAIVLGIVALCGYVPLTLALVGLLCLGVAVLYSGAALGSRMLTMLPH